MIKQTAIILVLLLSFPTIATAEEFTDAGGKPDCIDEASVMHRYEIIKGMNPNVSITIDADEEQYKHVLAAINTVLGVGHEIHASHFQTVFMPRPDGRKSALVMYGDQADQFCNFVVFTADQVEEVSKLMNSTGI